MLTKAYKIGSYQIHRKLQRLRPVDSLAALYTYVCIISRYVNIKCVRAYEDKICIYAVFIIFVVQNIYILHFLYDFLHLFVFFALFLLFYQRLVQTVGGRKWFGLSLSDLLLPQTRKLFGAKMHCLSYLVFGIHFLFYMLTTRIVKCISNREIHICVFIVIASDSECVCMC